MTVAIAPIYGAVIAVLFIVLAARVIRYRAARHISLGDGGDAEMVRRMRAQGNCAEYAPLGLLLLLMAELHGAPSWGLHAAGLGLVAGRIAHAVALSGPMNFPLRTVGMALTFGSIGLSALLGLL